MQRIGVGEQLAEVVDSDGYRAQRHPERGMEGHVIRLLRTRQSPRLLTANMGRVLTRLTK